MRRFPLCLAALVAASAPLLADDAQDKAVAAVENLGGKLTRDEKAEGKPVVAVDLSYQKVTAAGLKEVARLKGLKTLNLGGCKYVTDYGLEKLAPLPVLHTLLLPNAIFSTT